MERALRFHVFSLCVAAFAALPFSSSALTPEETRGAKRLLLLGAEKAKEAHEQVQRRARANVQAVAGRQPDCRAVAAALEERWPEFLLAARLSHDIYKRAEGRSRWRPGKGERQEIVAGGQRITLWFDAASKGYAEVHHDALDGAEILVFRGTQLRNIEDLSANLRQFANFVPERYRWAARLAARVAGEAPGKRLFVTGHSLGGGLAAYAALTREAEAVIFNPAGLSAAALATLPASALKTGERNIVSFIARGGETLDPVSALSLSGKGTIAGRRYLVDRGYGLTPLQIHHMAGFFQEAPGDSGMPVRCDTDLGAERLDEAPASFPAAFQP
jgi:alpha-beta hydrolase superfamily lysophospholipase